MAKSRAKVRVSALADRQWGRVKWSQFEGLGVAPGSVARWVESGYLHPKLPGVYAVGHGAPSEIGDLVDALFYAWGRCGAVPRHCRLVARADRP
jgi:hypothetical protein